MVERVVLHVDFDYFYAQCEEIRKPHLRTVPVCVCVYSGRGGDSGAVATANYSARKYGAKSGMPIYRARQLLEGSDARFLPVDFGHYSDISEKAMGIMERYADTFQYVGRDEAYLDVTVRTGGDYNTGAHLAQQIKNDIRESLRLTCSAGVSPNKMLSKMASDHKKPDGLTVIPPESALKFLDPLDPGDIPGIGSKTARALASMGVSTIRDMRELDAFDLQRRFGRKLGAYIRNAARGVDEEPVRRRPPSVQYSRIITLKRDMSGPRELEPEIIPICDTLHASLARRDLLFRSVGIMFVHSDMSSSSRSKTLRNHTASARALQDAAVGLLRHAAASNTKPVRRLGVKVSDLTQALGQQDITSYF